MKIMSPKEKRFIFRLVGIAFLLSLFMISIGISSLINVLIGTTLIFFGIGFGLRLVIKSVYVYYFPFAFIILFLIYGLVFYTFFTSRSEYDRYALIIFSLFLILAFSAALLALALGYLFEFKYYENKEIIFEKFYLKYKDIILLIILLSSFRYILLFIFEIFDEVSYVGLISIILLLNLIYIGIDLFVRYVVKYKKVRVKDVLLTTLFVFYLIFPFLDWFYVINNQTIDNFKIFTLSFLLYVIVFQIIIIYRKRESFIKEKSNSNDINNMCT